MRKLMTIAALAALALPGTALGQTTPAPKNAAQLCKAQRTAMGEQTFKMTYGTNANRSNAFGKCVSRMARAEAQAAQSANAACRQERETLGETAFNAKYGKNRNDRNAFGKCVSQKQTAAVQTQQQQTVNAASACKAERRTMGTSAFNAKYGKNRSDRNAFGKCVSQRARG